MDKIYSRRRFLLPKIRKRAKLNYRKFNFKRRDNSNIKNNLKSDLVNKLNHDGRNGIDGKNSIDIKKIKKVIKVLAIISIAVCIANKMLSSIQPIINTLSRDMAKSIAVKISNEQATKAMRKL